jgi:16S rRNA (cytosine1402-N4)-methyltransferase
VSEEPRHRAVLLEAAVAALNIRKNGIYVDATFGRGGHSRRILEQLGQDGKLIALDRDPQAIEAAGAIADPRFKALHARFAQLRNVLEQLGVAQVHGVLLDLGVSTPQLEDRDRGFSFKREGPLDMRMDSSAGMSARDWLNQAGEREIAEVIKTYGEERFASQIARAIVAARALRPLATTRELATLAAGAVKTRERGQDPATRTFQAIRIFINRELEELEAVLAQALDALAPGGRLAVISFHSLEDRMVKRFMREAAKPDRLPARLPLKASELPQPQLKIIGKPAYASPAEISANPRARSAVLRVAQKLEAAA